ncbi:MAG: DUF4294 domain-containing protein [Bacteroidales bacterium]
MKQHSTFLIALAAMVFGLSPVDRGALAQTQKPTTPQLVKCVIIEGDTFVYHTLPVFHFFSPKVFKSKKERDQYNRLVRNVKRVYPYARLAGIKLREYNEQLLATNSEKERKEIMRRAEEDLDAEFGKELRKLTFSQGVILLKLVDRETGQTGYDLVSELRGTFRAFFWQGIGRIFGYNLKMQYEPKTKDKEIEEIVLKIMYGQL